MRKPSPNNGTSLVEVLVGVSILAVSLTVILGIQSGSIENTIFINDTTKAVFLARAKMIETDALLRKEGFGSFDEQEVPCEFEEDSDPQRHFFCHILVEKVQQEDIIQQIQDYKVSDEEAKAAQERSVLSKKQSSAILGLQPNQNTLGITPDASLGMVKLFLPKIMETFQIEDILRRITLTIFWYEGKYRREFALQTYVVNLTAQMTSDPSKSTPTATTGGTKPSGTRTSGTARTSSGTRATSGTK